MIRRLLIGIAIVLVGSFHAACTNSTVTESQEIVFPESNVSYRNHVDPFLTLACGQCHGTINPAGDIVLTTYDGLLFSRPNLVVPGKPDESLLIQVLELVLNHPVGNLAGIPPNQVNGMRTWVEEGAEQN